MKHSESIAAIAEALAAAQAEYVTVPKSKTAKVSGMSKTGKAYDFSYKYADLADILSMALPRLSKQGVSVLQPHVIVDGKLRVCTYLLHKSGEWMQSDGIEISEASPDPQQMGIESTYFRRYDLASLIGVAPDEDTDAQQSGDRTRKVTPASVYPQGATSHPENAPRPTSTQQSAQQVTQRAATAPAAAHPQAGVVRFIPPNGLTVTVRNVTVPSEEKLAELKERKIKPSALVSFLGEHNGVDIASCFDTKYWPLLKECVGLECHFQIKEADKNDTHYINVVDVIYVDGQEYVDAKPVVTGDIE